MKKRFKTTILSCLVCIGTLVYSTLPVWAVGPGSCTHEFLADSVEYLETGNYDYRANGHYREYARIKTCLTCRYEVSKETNYKFDSGHNYNYLKPTITFNPDGTAEMRYYCTFDGCPFYYQ